MLCVEEQIASKLLHFIFGVVEDDFGCFGFFFLGGGEGVVDDSRIIKAVESVKVVDRAQGDRASTR